MMSVIPQIVDTWAEKSPGKEAFRCGTDSLSFGELATKSNQLARTLHDSGVQHGDRVGIYLHKTIESAIAVYGILKAGAAFVPIDPLSPFKRLESVVKDAGMRHLVSQDIKRPELDRLAATGTDLRCVVGLTSSQAPLQSLTWNDVFAAPTGPPATEVKPDDMAYLMYTSGSTGEPKGIIHTHASGLSYALFAAKTYGLSTRDRLSGFPPLHFDQSTFDYFAGPSAGATTVVISDAHMRLPASLSSLMEAERLTIWYSVPLALSNLLHHGALEQRDLNSLRWVLFGGEPFAVKSLRELMLRWPHARFSNVYGPAETNQVTVYNVPSLSETDDPIPIGRIWDNAEGMVVDETGNGVAAGTEGELAVSTPAMMSGYWNRPDLTRKAMLSGRSPGTGEQVVFYRTGDRVRELPGGTLLFLGRNDRQIKIRGQRVELDAIEQAVAGFSSVDSAAVFTSTADDYETLIHVVLTTLPDAIFVESELRKYLSDQIPKYAMPADIEVVAELPLTPTGKIDRNALRELRAVRA